MSVIFPVELESHTCYLNVKFIQLQHFSVNNDIAVWRLPPRSSQRFAFHSYLKRGSQRTMVLPQNKLLPGF